MFEGSDSLTGHRTLVMRTVVLFTVGLLLAACGSRPSNGKSQVAPTESCAQLVSGPPIGLACIHCMHPKAQAQAFELSKIIRNSCRQSIVVNYLIDGSFGEDDAFLIRHISDLSQDRQLTVILYLSNGAAQRIWKKTRVHGFGTDISPTEFRTRMVSDNTLRDRYHAIVARAVQIGTHVPTNVSFVLVPALEDNLDDQTFNNMLDLTQQVAGTAVQYGRSACPDCVPGSGSAVPLGVLLELHIVQPSLVTPNAIVSNDGFSYRLPDGSPGTETLQLDDLIALKAAAANAGDMFILWTAEFQGVPDITVSANAALSSPDARTYLTPSGTLADLLTHFLLTTSGSFI